MTRSACFAHMLPHVAGDGGLAATLQLLHLFLEAPAWEEAAMDRAKQLYVSHYRALPKSLERASADRVMSAMLGPDRYARTLRLSTSGITGCFRMVRL